VLLLHDAVERGDILPLYVGTAEAAVVEPEVLLQQLDLQSLLFPAEYVYVLRLEERDREGRELPERPMSRNRP